ncbi:MAG: thymidine kinase [Hyphococcus sp.]|nr:MAG: thymidine kinase [Marinicaulis sp.]
MAKLYFNYAAMNAGKSTSLLQASFNYRERGMQTFEFTAAIDNRDLPGSISSRIGLSQSAHLFSAETDLFEVIQSEVQSTSIDCIFLDEAQFLKEEQVIQLTKIVDMLKIPVICYGLRTDFCGKLFEGSANLLALADIIRELKTICHCGAKATMNLRIDLDGNTITTGEKIAIGGNDMYTALCRKHFFEKFGYPPENP